MPVHQTANVVDDPNQLVSFSFDSLVFLQGYGSVDLFTVNDVPIAAVAPMVESLEMNYQVLWSSVELHCFFGQFVVLANITVPGVLLSESLGLREAIKELSHCDLIAHFPYKPV